MKQSKQVQRESHSKIRNQSSKKQDTINITSNRVSAAHLNQKRVSLGRNQQRESSLLNSKQKSQTKIFNKSQNNSNNKSKNEDIVQKELFDGYSFLIEVYQGRNSMAELIAPKILQNGGKIVNQMTPKTSYVVFENGPDCILDKVVQDKTFSKVNIITPFWIQQSINRGELQNMEDFQPLELNDRIIQHENKTIRNSSQKKNIQNSGEINQIMLDSEEEHKIQGLKINQVSRAPHSYRESVIPEKRNSRSQSGRKQGSQRINSSEQRKNKKVSNQKRNSPTKGIDDNILEQQIQEESRQKVAKAAKKADVQAIEETKNRDKISLCTKEDQSRANNKNTNQKKKGSQGVQQTLNLLPAAEKKSGTNQQQSLLNESMMNLDKEDVDKTFQKVKEDYQFKKDFEKQIKKFNKMIDPFKQSSNNNSFLLNQSVLNDNQQNQTQIGHLSGHEQRYLGLTQLAQYEQSNQSIQIDENGKQLLGQQQNHDESMLFNNTHFNQSMISLNPLSQLQTTLQQKPRRDPKYMTKNQLIETYIDGDIELHEFIEHIQPKYKKKGNNGGGLGNHQRKADNSNNRRISEMYTHKTKIGSQPINNSNEDDSTSICLNNNENDQKPVNKSMMVSLQDYLLDLDEDEDSSTFQKGAQGAKDKSYQPHSQANIPGGLKQGNLISMGFGQRLQEQVLSQQPRQDFSQSIYNYKPQSIFSVLPNERVTKSFTLPTYSKKIKDSNLQTIEESPRFGKENHSPNSRLFNFDLKPYKRSNSCLPYQSQPSKQLEDSVNKSNFTYLNSKDHLISKLQRPNRKLQFNQHNIEEQEDFAQERGRQTKQKLRNNEGAKCNQLQRRDWSKVVPARKNPTRGCKLNVSYIEDENEKAPTYYDVFSHKNKPIYHR